MKIFTKYFNCKSILLPIAIVGLAMSVYNSFGTTYSSGTGVQASTAAIVAGVNDQEILKVTIVAGGGGALLYRCRLDFTMANTNNADISNAKLYYTTSTNSFLPLGTLLGTVANPTGTISFTFSHSSNAGTFYYWLAYDVKSTATNCDVFDATVAAIYTGTSCPGASQTITTPNPAGSRTLEAPGCWTYCTSTHTVGTTYYLSNVCFGSINNTTTNTCGSMYCDYTSQSTTVAPGTDFDITVTAKNGANPANVYVYFDWNNNGTLTNGSPEQYFIGQSPATGPTTLGPVSISVPGSATVGTTRMRIVMTRSDDVTDPCNPHASGYGETEDYSVVVCSSIPAPPTSSGASRCGTGTLTLTASGAGAGEDYKWYDAASCGTLLQTNGSSYTTPSIASTTFYYVEIYNTTSGCTSSPRTSVVATVNTSITITAQPTNQSTCTNGDATFSLTATGTDLEYQWQVSTDGGGIWTDLSNGGVYSNVTTASLQLNGVTSGMNSYQYRCVVTGACPSVTSSAVILTVTAGTAPTTANAGPDQAVGASTATLAGNTPVVGTGTWTCITNCGGVTITTPTSPTSGVTGLAAGVSTTFRWTTSNGGCATNSTDDVIISRYCIPDFPSNVYSIINVTFGAINNTTADIAGGASPDYEDFTAQSTNVSLSSTFPISINVRGSAGSTSYINVFFDWNKNGVFTDAGEEYQLGTHTAATATITGSILVPSDAIIATTRMRVINKILTAYATPCIVAGFGQAEDYAVIVCDVSPGTISPSATSICPVGGTTVISISGYTGGSTFQWEQSTDNITFINAVGGSGATTATYTTAALGAGTYYFRCRVTNGCSSNSSNCIVSVNAALCTPSGPYTTGFETCDATMATSLTTGVAMSVINTVSPNSGTRHASIEGLGGGGQGAFDGSFITSSALVFVPGRIYTVEVWGTAYGGNGCFGNLKVVKSATNTNIAMKAASGSDIIVNSTQLTNLAANTVSYVLLSSSFQVTSPESKYIGVQLFSGGVLGCGGNQIFVDDFVIKSTCTQCSDGVQNGNETSIDCGGTMCVTGAPAGGTIAPAATSIACGAAGNFSLCLSGSTGLIQWQMSPTGAAPWNDIGTLGNNTSYSGTATTTMSYRAKVTNDGCVSTPAYSNTATVTITGITAKTWDAGAGTSNWLDANNWNPNGVPTSCNDVTLGVNVTVNGAATCHNLTITGGILTLNTGNTNYLTIYGNILNNSTITQTVLNKTEGIALQGSGVTWGGTGTTYTNMTVKIEDGSDTYMTSDATIASINATKTSVRGILSLNSNTLKITYSFIQQGSTIHVNTGLLWLEIDVDMTIDQSTLYPDYGTVFWDLTGGWGITGPWNTQGGSGFYNLRMKSTGGYIDNNCNHRARNNFTVESGTGTVRFNSGTARTLQCEGNFINYDNDGASFTPGLSTVSMEGDAAQQITGTTPTNFYKLTINNSSTGVTQTQPVTVTNTLALTNGAFNLNSLTATVTNALPAGITRTNGYVVSETQVANNTSKLQWNIGSNTSAHIFPFGTTGGSYIPITFDGSGASGNITISTRPTSLSDNMPKAAASNVGACTDMKGIGDSISSAIDRWWDITSSVSSPLPAVNLTLSYLGSENTMTIVADRTTQLGIQHWNGSVWDNGKNGGAGTVTLSAENGVTGGVGSLSVTGLTYFSPFIAVKGSKPLPIELLLFTAYPIKDIVKIKWSTATETNNDYFTIEHSKEGKDFEPVSIVKSHAPGGNSSMRLDYRTNDEKPFKGVSYYRLKQTDFDGKYSYSNVVAVELKEGIRNLYVYPNPATNKLNIVVGENERSVVKIYDVTGQVVSESTICNPQSAICNIDIASLSKGVYFVSLSDGNDIRYARFVKE